MNDFDQNPQTFVSNLVVTEVQALNLCRKTLLLSLLLLKLRLAHCMQVVQEQVQISVWSQNDPTEGLRYIGTWAVNNSFQV